MAFNVKKIKRLPNENDPYNDDGANADNPTGDGETGGEGNTGDGENGTEGDSTNATAPWKFIPEWLCPKPSNVVATQPWVCHVLRKFWNWTRFFATQTLHVAGGLKAGRVKTNEIQTGDIYANRLILLDPDGNPAVLTVDANGKMEWNYNYQDVFIYPGELDVRNYVYRYGTKPENIAANFVGLTPYETLINFIPYESNEVREFNDTNCPKVCGADGTDALIGPTLMVTCSKFKKIVSISVYDADGEEIPEKTITLPTDYEFRKLTINMPCFKNADGTNTAYVNLPGKFAWEGPGALKPFLPPFLLPPCPPHLAPPVKPTMSPGKYPYSLNHDIFSDDNLIPDSDGFYDKLLNDEEGQEPYPDTEFKVGKDYQVAYEDYFTSTYCNITLKRNHFNPNEVQFIVVNTATANNTGDIATVDDTGNTVEPTEDTGDVEGGEGTEGTEGD